MWHDEPIEVKRGRTGLLAASLAAFGLIILAIAVTLSTAFRALSLCFILSLLTNLATWRWSPKSIKERLLRERCKEFEESDPIAAELAVVQDGIQTGSDLVLVWIEDARLRIEGCESSISLTTSDFAPVYQFSLVESTLEYSLEDRIYRIMLRPRDDSTVKDLDIIMQKWLKEIPAPGQSYMPIDVQPTFYEDKRKLYGAPAHAGDIRNADYRRSDNCFGW